ncbi:MAG: ribosomal RNA small subunit methyltransferase A [Chitinophagales bacterium]|nr:ribosomal RNA small subunit methyltransferase A [Chitinophagaceae bacterium]MCB9065534.1 ribosomal RNA small subunit methyltransferase A [Chitinophagales bacterium]
MCMKIVESVSYKEGLQLLEVGPGGGAITKYLIQKQGVDFKAVEVDEEKVEYLLKTYPELEGKLIQKDILKADKPFEGKFNVIGNFPYNISSQILFVVLDWEEDVDEVIGMFQKEVAQRVASKEGNKVYGILSVLLQTFFEIEYLFDVPQKCFTPPPKVMSGVIRMKNTGNPYKIENKKKYKTLVKTAFGQRRKTLRNALKPLLSAEALSDKVFDKRAEQLSVEDFVNLYKQYYL